MKVGKWFSFAYETKILNKPETNSSFADDSIVIPKVGKANKQPYNLSVRGRAKIIF